MNRLIGGTLLSHRVARLLTGITCLFPIFAPAAPAQPKLSSTTNMAYPFKWVITGKVVDAKTKRPLDKFKLELWEELFSLGTMSGACPTITNGNGTYSVEMLRRKTPARLLVEAGGYLPVLTPFLAPPTTTYHIELTKGYGPRGHVFQPNGQPASDCRVVLLVPSCTANTMAFNEVCEFDPPNSLKPERMTTRRLTYTNSNLRGWFCFDRRLGDESGVVVAASKDGFAFVTTASLAAQEKVALQPWISISGRLMSKGQPLAKAAVGARIMPLKQEHAYEESRWPWRPVVFPTASTDALGRFAFPKMPPIDLEIVLLHRVLLKKVDAMVSINNVLELGDIQVPD